MILDSATDLNRGQATTREDQCLPSTTQGILPIQETREQSRMSTIGLPKRKSKLREQNSCERRESMAALIWEVAEKIRWLLVVVSGTPIREDLEVGGSTVCRCRVKAQMMVFSLLKSMLLTMSISVTTSQEIIVTLDWIQLPKSIGTRQWTTQMAKEIDHLSSAKTIRIMITRMQVLQLLLI